MTVALSPDRAARRHAGPPRVLIVSHLFPGPENPSLGCFVHEQVRALRLQEGVDARVVSGRRQPLNRAHPLRLWYNYRAYRGRFAALRWQEHDEVPVVYLPYLVDSFLSFYWLHGPSYRAAFRRALPFLRGTFAFDLIHAHTSYLDGGAARLLSRQLGVPYVITEHTNPFRTLMDNPLIRRQTLQALMGAARVWCVSSALTAEVQGYLPTAARGRVHTLPNGVDTDAFALPDRWQPDPAAPRLLSVTALEAYKNPLLLLEAFRRLRQEVPRATLTLVGAGPLEPQVRAFLREHALQQSVSLPGRCSRAEVARLMREACDLVALSSDSETFGVVLIEAQACGKPVVATDCGGPRDVITEPALGELCRPGDPAALADALRRAVRALPAFDPQRIRGRAVERFSFLALAARLADIYRAGATAARAA
jgi:glycosyltransferase involved in cell wall biosynthesis